MTTLLTKLGVENAASVGIDPVTVSATETQIFENANVLRWFRADTGFDATGWRCRKTGDALVSTGDMPTRVRLPEYNDQPSLLFVGGDDLSLVGGYPTGTSHSYVLVGRPGIGDNAFLVGNTSSVDGNTYLQHALGGGPTPPQFLVSATSGGTVVVASAAVGNAAPNLYTCSQASDLLPNPQLSIRVNRGAIADAVRTTGAAATTTTDSVLRVGSTGPVGSPSGPLEGGEIAELIILDTALHVETAARDVIESYLATRYGL